MFLIMYLNLRLFMFSINSLNSEKKNKEQEWQNQGRGNTPVKCFLWVFFLIRDLLLVLACCISEFVSQFDLHSANELQTDFLLIKKQSSPPQ